VFSAAALVDAAIDFFVPIVAGSPIKTVGNAVTSKEQRETNDVPRWSWSMPLKSGISFTNSTGFLM
jgi:hypothetical protein